MRHTPLFGALILCVACLIALTAQMAAAQSAQPTVVISQIYGGGGNSGATYTHDFIELFNWGEEPVSLAGWSVQYASANGTNWQKTELTGTIQPGRYFLIQQAQGSRGTAELPTPDAVGSIAMSSSSGKVALLNTAGLLTRGTTCPEGASLVDLVGFGGTDCFAGSTAASGLDNSMAGLRAHGGCLYTGDNGENFHPGSPAPRNSASATMMCEASPTPRSALSITQTTTTQGLITSLPIPAIELTTTAQISDTDQPSMPTVATTRSPASTAISMTERLVISQIFGGGGNAGAIYTHDFVELYNASPLTVEMDGWSLQYASATGKTWLVTLLTGTIAPGEMYLIQQAQGASGSAALPIAHAFGETAMSASSGKVALVHNIVPLTGVCPEGESIADFVGYGNANCFEGEGPAARPSNTRAVIRVGEGAQDTDDNQTDFLAAPPQPGR